MLVRVFNGVLKPRDKILLMANGSQHLVEQVGVFTPKSRAREQLSAGEVGFIIAGIKELKAAKVGDTVTLRRDRPPPPLPGFKEAKPQVFAGLFPVESNQYDALARRAREAAAERCVAAVRARGVAGARLRLSLRLPRPAAHGDRAGAARARVRHGPDHDRAVGRLQVADARRQRDRRSRTRRRCRTPAASRRSASRSSRSSCTCRRTTSASVITLAIQKRGVQIGDGLPRQAGHADLRDAARGDRARLLRQAEVGVARLRVDGLRVQGVPRGRRRQGRHADQRGEGRRARRDRRIARTASIAAARSRRRCAS